MNIGRSLTALALLTALTGCAAGTVPDGSDSQPVTLANAPASDAPETTETAEPDVLDAYPDADEAGFLVNVHTTWAGSDIPGNDALVEAGVLACEHRYEDDPVQLIADTLGIDWGSAYLVFDVATAQICPVE